ncbi:MAG: hypothetical protein UDD86_02255, partial [Sodaliphilus sp.]|nr:hypothetical protein [Sodaliphilus sp.]
QRQGAEPRRASTLNAFSTPKPHFLCKHSNFWYAFGIYKPKEPSLWFLWFATEPLRREWWRKKGNAGRCLGLALGVGVLALEAAPTIQEVGFFSIENLYYLTTCSLVNFTVPLL